MIEDLGGEEEDEDGQCDEDDRPIDEHDSRTKSGKVDPEEKAFEKEEETGDLVRVSGNSTQRTHPYLCELSPIERISGVKLEDEDVIDLGSGPDAAIHAKE